MVIANGQSKIVPALVQQHGNCAAFVDFDIFNLDHFIARQNLQALVAGDVVQIVDQFACPQFAQACIYTSVMPN